MQIGERQSNINIANGRKSSVILEAEAATMDQVKRPKETFEASTWLRQLSSKFARPT
ncbi:hypothetical protein M5K25_018052 [Dendrobium thyrsiflorum]|uniref:Uncharacterized protein n=1 Tax=Dendrobium thyrsiflorum TaxID=117978 RepID=A0ABD0UP91_DENTH